MSFYPKGSRVDKTKRETNDKNINPFNNQQNWIGAGFDREPVPTTLSGYHAFDKAKPQWIDKKQEPKTDPKPQAETRISIGQQSSISRGVTIGNKSPIELMQDILKGVRQGEQICPFYSKESEESLSELLTNKFKLNSYVKRLESDMVSLDSRVVKNYEVLVLLLQQVSNADVEVKHGDGGIQIKFNRGIIQRQQAQIERLQKQKQQREKQMKYVIDEYESIIFNFNDVIQKLVNREEGRHKPKF